MSIIGKILDIFGPGGGNNFYARDFRNAYGFRPDVNPPRQKFQGYVSFVVNRELYGDTFYGEEQNSKFRLRLGSLVRTASLPEVEFKTETKNAYNRKRIVNTGVEYQPVDIKVFDTINNEWLIMFMKYFTYHYMNPRNKQFNGSGAREVGDDPRQAKTSQHFANSEFGPNDGPNNWDSNAYGYNVNELANFFERIDYVLYHGGRGVQYSLINPVLTRFRTGEIDYASSDVMEFDMTFEYESFTISQEVNFGLSEFDIARFEDVRDFKGPAFVPFNKPVLLETERKLEVLSGFSRAEGFKRARQPQPSRVDPTAAAAETASDTGDVPSPPPPIDSDLAGSPEFQAQAAAEEAQAAAAQPPTDAGAPEPGIIVTGTRPVAPPPATVSPLPSIYGPRAKFAEPTGKNKSFIEGLLGNIADNALSAAIHGTSIKNAVINTAVGGITQGIVGVANAAIRGDKTQPGTEEETGTGSTAEKPPVTPEGGG